MIHEAAIADFFSAGIITATPIAYAASGGCLLERCGVYAIALEGMMLSGCFSAVYVGVHSGSALAGVAAGGLGGAIAALVLAVACVWLGADQIVASLAVNILALGATSYALGDVLANLSPTEVPQIPQWHIPFFGDLAGVGSVLFDQSLATYLVLPVAFLCWYVLFRTRWGLAIRAVGEFPRAADTQGVSPLRVRVLALSVCGTLAGIGGAVLALQIAGTFTEGMTGGRGFIALAAVIFARWNPLYAVGAALLFGLADALQVRFQVLGIPLSSYFVQMTPYVVALIALIILGGRAQYARAIGQAYDRRQR
jgi:simple sugar transport system permease protein